MSAAHEVDAASSFVFGRHERALVPAEANSMQVRAVFDGFPSAVAALCAVVDGVEHGLVATSMTVGVSYDPPMVLFSVRNESLTWPNLRHARRIGVSVMGEGQGAQCRQLASAKGVDRFAGLDAVVTSDDALFLVGSVTWMSCSIADVVPAGDHSVVLMRIHEVGHATDTEPLVFHRSGFRMLRRTSDTES